MEEPTAFAMVFVVEKVRFEYRVAATKTLVIHESLRAWPLGKEQTWFERDWNPETRRHDFGPENPTGLPRNRDIEQRALRNMLYLSKAVAENRKEVEPVFRWLVSRFKFLDLSTRNPVGQGFTLSQIDGKGDQLKNKIMKVLRHADLGIVDALAIEKEPDKDVLKILQSLSNEVSKSLKLDGEKRPRFTEPQFFHQGPGNTSLPLEWKRESAGTHRFFALIGPWLAILENGYTVCIDEIETSMHPIMVRELLKLILSETENTGGAQIIFTTHNPLFLDGSLLRRDQVWFTDKDDEGKSHLYPLTEYQPRQDESLIRGYMAGRYGAVPFVPRGLLGTFSNLEAAETDKEDSDG
jgi:AAA15 family ATPase/GTPase